MSNLVALLTVFLAFASVDYVAMCPKCGSPYCPTPGDCP